MRTEGHESQCQEAAEGRVPFQGPRSFANQCFIKTKTRRAQGSAGQDDGIASSLEETRRLSPSAEARERPAARAPNGPCGPRHPAALGFPAAVRGTWKWRTVRENEMGWRLRHCNKQSATIISLTGKKFKWRFYYLRVSEHLGILKRLIIPLELRNVIFKDPEIRS